MAVTPRDAPPLGFRAGAVMAGVKTGRPERLDVGLIVSDRPCAGAGVFTTNQVIAAPCVLTRRHLDNGVLQAIAANSGIANACTGEAGDADALAMAEAAATAAGCAVEDVAVASTGVIGWRLPAERIGDALGRIVLSESGFDDFASAIMTTDTRPKQVRAVADVDGGTIRVRGIAKGAGMIHPNMATMLGFVLTDADVPLDALRAITRRAADASFNAISVDGDTSTNDTLLVLANGASGVAPGARTLALVEELVTDVCRQLAREIVADGEGVTKVFAVHVRGAASDADARLAARAVTRSNLVKTAIHGADPNWGRILAAAGASGARVDDRRATVRIGSVDVFRGGTPVPFDPAAVRRLFEQHAVEIDVDLGLGTGSATAWGADLSAEYVRINAEYTT